MASFTTDELDSLPGLPRSVELVNLTPHAVTVRAQAIPDTDDQAVAECAVTLPQPTSAPPGTPVLTPARVIDDELPPMGQVIRTRDALISLVRLRRGSRITGLPRPRPGTVYVVSRLTALAAARRDDLVFPHREVRDGSGTPQYVEALASFTPRWSLTTWWGNHRAALLVRRSRRAVPQDWFTAMLFSVGVTVLSAAVGLIPGVIDTWRVSGFGGEKGQARWTATLTIALAVAGPVVLGWAVWRWRERQRIIDARGTAYIIEEQATYWVHEEKVSTLRIIAANFARVLRVPGPAALDPSWAWSTSPGPLGQWDQRVDELVSAFRAVHFNDDQVSHNAVFLWAPWPVALAFGARVTAGMRGLTLHVRQRPSFGNSATPRPVVLVEDSPHDFHQPDPAELRDLDSHQVLPTRYGTITVHLACADASVQRPNSDGPPIRLLMIGINAEVFAGLTPRWDHPVNDHSELEGASAQATIQLPAELARFMPENIEAVPCAQWRLSPIGSGAAANPDLPWESFPAAAASIAEWIRDETSRNTDVVHLLACRAPQEILLGVGIISKQIMPGQPPWPSRMYPVMYADGNWSTPNVRLGQSEFLSNL